MTPSAKGNLEVGERGHLLRVNQGWSLSGSYFWFIVDAGPYLQALQIGADAEYHGFRDICTDIDNTHGTHVWTGCRASIAKHVCKTLKVMEEDPHRENNVVEHYGRRLHNKDICYVYVLFYMYYICYVCSFLQTINKLWCCVSSIKLVSIANELKYGYATRNTHKRKKNSLPTNN